MISTPDIIEGFRLSPQQRRVWLLQQAGESFAYRSQCAVRIEGDLKAEVLREAIERVVSRHEILRTVFPCLPEMSVPVQVVSDAAVSWRSVDISSLEVQAQEVRVNELFDDDRKAGFDFANGPILHATLASLGAGKHVLLLRLPALSADARTLNNLMREISEAYAASIQGEPLFEPSLQYVQFAEWQNELLDSDDENAELGREFWRRQNISSFPNPKLPFEIEPGEQTAFTPETLVSTFDPRVFANIEATAQRHYVSSPVFLLACWQTLLWRLTGSDVVVSNVSDGREYEGLHSALGLFAKALPIHCNISSDSRFSELLEQTNDLARETYDWQSFFNCDQTIGDARDFPIGFEFDESAAEQSVAGVSFRMSRQYSCSDRFKLKLLCRRIDSSLAAEFQYDTQVYEHETIQRIARHFEALVQSALHNPDSLVSHLDILDATDRQQLLVTFNQTKTHYPQDKCIHELFEQQVERTPDKIALICEEEQLTYAQLNARANQLAHLLRSRGVGPNVLVGLCVERSVAMLSGLLGINKAGAAYVPLNPDHPRARLSQQLSDLRSPVLITQQKLLDQLPGFDGEVICLDNPSVFDKEPTVNLNAPVTPETLAYVLYTSGSTGVPKGVAVEHRNLLNYTHFICDKLKLNDSQGLNFASVSTITADLGNTCIFPSLVSGGCLHILTYEVATDGAKFAQYFQRHPIDVLKIVPSHLSSLLDTAGTTNCLPRKYLILGGDILSWDLAERLSHINEQCEVINHYGPTETTVGSLTFDLRENRSLIQKTASVPIGRPIANTAIYILDSELKPTPIGVPGQLCIAGAGVAEGYLNQPEETAKRFISNPFSTDGMARLYLTGDLARYLPDGNVEFLGRLDHQVKIRGYRVELGEIETLLSRHPEVRQAVVVSHRDSPNDQHLVAYVVPRHGKSPTNSTFRTYLSEHLPDYMVPGTFMFLNALPLTSNGKIDRTALPLPEATRPDLERAYSAPRTPVEEIITDIWAKLLKLEVVGVHDNFFHLGGHSLMVTQVVSRMRVAFGVELPLRVFFESPTIAALAAKVEKELRDQEQIQTPPLVRVSRDEYLPLSFAQQRLWFLDQLEQGSSFYNISKSFRFRGNLNVEALSAALNEIVRRHEPLRTSFVSVEGTPFQQIEKPQPLSLPVCDLRVMPESEREAEARRLVSERRREPFDLSRAPLLRATLIRIEQEEWVFVLTMHHIAGDAWSLSVLFRELTVLYAAFAQNKPSPLPDLKIQFADFAAWQRSWFEGELLDKHVSYWRQQLAGAPLVLELPTDKPRPPEQTFRGARFRFDLSLELSADLKALSRREGVTVFMTFLAAYQLLLSRYSGQKDLIVGADVANRNRVETEAMIGFFVNVLPLRISLADNPTFIDLLRHVREITLRAYAHQEVPFEKLVAELKPKRDLSRNPLVQVLLVMQNAPAQELQLEGTSVTPFEMPAETSRFDLALVLWERDGRFSGSFLYNPDLFEAQTIERMFGHFETLLRSILEDPSSRVDSLRMKTSEEVLQEEVEKRERHQLQVHSLRDTRRRGVELN